MQACKKLKARILSLALSVAMVTTMMPINVFAAEGSTELGASSVGTIRSFDKLEDRFEPSTGEGAAKDVYVLNVELDTLEEDLRLPGELTAMVARTTVTAPDEDEPVVDSGKVDKPAEDEYIPDEDKVVDEDTATDDTVSGNQPAAPSDAEEEVKDETTEIKNEDVPLAPIPVQNVSSKAEDKETVTTTIKSESIPVEWNSDKEYVSDKNGEFIYTAELAEDYILADGVELPQIQVTVGIQARTAGTITQRTTMLNLKTISANNPMGATHSNGVFTHATEGWVYDTNKTPHELTLNGMNCISSESFSQALRLDNAALKIILTEGSTNTLSTTTKDSVIGTFGSNNKVVLEITGGGKLSCVSNGHYGIDLSDANVTISGKADVSANGSFGVRFGTLIMDGGTLNAAGATAGVAAYKALTLNGSYEILGSATLNDTAENLTAAAYNSQDKKVKMGASGDGATAQTVKIAPVAASGGLSHNIGTDGALTLTTGDGCAASTPHVITGATTTDSTTNVVTVSGGTHYVTLNNVNIDAKKADGPFAINAGTVHLTLKDGTTNTLTAKFTQDGEAYAGLFVKKGATLEINGTGSLTATSSKDSTMGAYGAGIGGSSLSGNQDAGTITIKGGTVTASGVYGIGGGAMGASKGIASAVTISGTDTVVTATGFPTTAAVGATTLTLTGMAAKYKVGGAYTGATNIDSNKIYEGTDQTTEAKDVKIAKESTPPTPPMGDDGGSSSGGGGSSSTTTPSKPTKPVTGTSNTNATVDDKGNATVNVTDKNIADVVKAAKEAANQKGVNAGEVTAVIRVTSPANTNPNIVTINLPRTVQQQVINHKIGSLALVIDKPDISIGMNLTTIREMNKQANADIRLSATRTDAATLPEEAKNAIGNRPAFDLKATYAEGSKSVTNFGAGTVSVAIPYTLQAGEVAGGLYAVYVDGNGKVNYITNSSYDPENKVLRFSTNHFSVYGIGYSAPIAFTDIASHWAKTDIEFAVNRGLIFGADRTTFAPDSAMTRGMFVTALGRLSGGDMSSYKTDRFSDVPTDAYYAPYVNWAVDKGIVKGTGDTTFAPDQAITRQEMAVMMSNYTKAVGYTVPETRTVVRFADKDSINSGAASAVRQMQMAGILHGKNGNKFDPTGIATRGEVSAMLHRYVELVIDRTTTEGFTTNDNGSSLYYQYGKAVTGEKTINNVAYNFNGYGEQIKVPQV